jgi:hypothetical protein
MNERIKQLLIKAIREVGAADDDNPGKEKTLEKFTELIVRECGQWVNDNLGLLDEEARADLLKHFGVEE